jgi:hypothetical protein
LALNATQIGTLTGSLLISAAFGALFAGPLAGKMNYFN